MFKASLLTALLLTGLSGTSSVWAADAAPLATVAVQTSGNAGAERMSFDGVVEAVRQSTLSAQVAGAIVALNVKAGDRVRAGQELLRIDARAASQNTAATVAQVEAARATMNVSSKEYERQKQLFQKQYISQSALDRAQAQFQASQAQMQALQAQSDAAHTQSRFFVINAPYAGIVSDVPVALGDMAMPGAPLLTLYDPAALRVSAPVPPTTVTSGSADAIQFEIPGLAQALLAPKSATLLPQVDAATHTAQLRLALPDSLKGATPGMFARVWLAASGIGKATSDSERLYVPASAVVRRAEMTGLYIVNDKGRPMLRQVRLGRAAGERIEVLSGVEKGEKVAIDPQAAAKVR
ncbi:MAG: efflux RND transporter periplasmic adaptor subunit [Rhodoferax sp.]|jgi:RND family efflux transporter MFP subunit|nr:efflux RND transporter periplasmic adaptor subunit [Rhodoferax sp.]